MLRLHLKPILEQRQIRLEQLTLALDGRLAKSTLLRMYRQPVRHIHLNSVQIVLKAINELTTEKVLLENLLVEE